MTEPYQELFELPVREKIAHLNKGEKIFHTIFSQQFSRESLESISRLANMMRRIAVAREGMNFLKSLLSHKRSMLYFVQPSTRTFLSFMAACQILGITCNEVRDTATSSEMKGESEYDSVHTFSSYFDLIIIRHKKEGLAERVAYMMNELGKSIPVLNAGSGRDQHPTQALLDIYTLLREFEKGSSGLDGRSIAFVGDLKRGRTVRSLTYLLSNYNNIKLYFVSPPELKLGDDLKEYLKKHKKHYEEIDDLNAILPELDAVYMTRIQDEHDVNGESKKIDYYKFSLSTENVKLMKPTAIILHPLPRRQEIEVAIDKDPRARYWEQTQNGMWARSALIATIFNIEGKIMEYFNDNFTY